MLKSKWLSLILDVDFMINYFEVGIFFIFLEFIIHLMASSHNFVESYQFNGILSYFKQILDSHLFNITYHLHRPSKICRFFLDFFLSS